MADTGVPSTISKSYADPSGAFNFLDTAVPNTAAMTEAQRRTDLAAQDSRTTQFNATTARMAEMRAQKSQEVMIRRAELEYSLDSALFDTKKRAQEADLNRVLLANESAKTNIDRQKNNDTVLSRFNVWLSSEHPENFALGATDQTFREFLSKAQGMDAIGTMQKAYADARANAFTLSGDALALKWGPDISSSILKDWPALSAGERQSRVTVGNARQGERELVHQAEMLNENLRPTVSPDFLIDTDQFKTGEQDKFGNDIYNGVGLRNEIENKKASFLAQGQVVTNARKEHTRVIQSDEKQNTSELTALEKELDTVNTSIARLATARESGTNDAFQVFLAEAMNNEMVKRGVSSNTLQNAKSSTNKETRDSARTELYNAVIKSYTDRQKVLQTDINKRLMDNPQVSFSKGTQTIQVLSRGLSDLQKKLEAGLISPEAFQATEQEVHRQYKEFDAKYGENAHTFYDGTYQVNPLGLPTE